MARQSDGTDHPVRLVPVTVMPSESGTLGVLQASEHIGFVPKRVYFLTHLPEGAKRGAHAHRRLRQCIVCLSGGVTLEVIKREHRSIHRLDTPGTAAILDAGCWRDLFDFAPGTVVVVIASEEYDPGDYIRSFEEFRQWEASGDAGIPYLDLRRTPADVRRDITLALDDVVQSGTFVGGPQVAGFEERFADFCGVASAVGTGNGLDALSIALRAAGIGVGDEVILPAHSFVATALAVTAVGAEPVLVDVDPELSLIEAGAIANAITLRTRAIIPVHLYGHPADMDPLLEIAAARNLFVLEDAAQAHGALYKGRPVGSLGDCAAFSFYPTKNLGALGDAGAIVTNDSRLATVARSVANYGSVQRYHHDRLGVNSRLDAMQAAMLTVKLGHIEAWNARRRALAAIYLEGLKDIPGLLLPQVRDWATPVWHVFALRVPGRRDSLREALARASIGTNLHYPVPIHLQACYSGRWSAGQFPVAEAICSDTLSLPLDPTHAEDEIHRVVDAVRRFFAA